MGSWEQGPFSGPADVVEGLKKWLREEREGRTRPPERPIQLVPPGYEERLARIDLGDDDIDAAPASLESSRGVGAAPVCFGIRQQPSITTMPSGRTAIAPPMRE